MSRLCLLLRTLPRALAVERPISTLGPSGPNEHPVPKVMAAAVARKTGAAAARICRLVDAFRSTAARTLSHFENAQCVQAVAQQPQNTDALMEHSKAHPRS
jgi:hypothetical protein